jgi:hypothetical protein
MYGQGQFAGGGAKVFVHAQFPALVADAVVPFDERKHLLMLLLIGNRAGKMPLKGLFFFVQM